MRIGAPAKEQLSQLRALWKAAFGDGDAFLDCFFETAFSPARCRCVTVDGNVAAALYWFDCSLDGEKIAYVYAVATANAFRGRGLCRTLMEDTHRHLSTLGYRGAVLVPSEPSLFMMYEKMGYQTCSYRRRVTCRAEVGDITLTELSKEDYALERRARLPIGGVLQEGENLDFLARQARFYKGEDLLLAARREEGRLIGVELLGSSEQIGVITHALGCKEGVFFAPGDFFDEPFGMFCGFDASFNAPSYFGFAFD